MSGDDIDRGDDGMDYVKLVSAEGAEIFLEKRVAVAGSETMKV